MFILEISPTSTSGVDVRIVGKNDELADLQAERDTILTDGTEGGEDTVPPTPPQIVVGGTGESEEVETGTPARRTPDTSRIDARIAAVEGEVTRLECVKADMRLNRAGDGERRQAIEGDIIT